MIKLKVFCEKGTTRSNIYTCPVRGLSEGHLYVWVG